jgi:hypothetical protein
MISVVVISRNQRSALERMLAALEAQVPECPRIFVLDRCTDDSQAFLEGRGERFLAKTSGFAFEAGATRDAGLALVDPGHDVLFLDADRAPVNLSPDLLEEALARFDLCLLKGAEDPLRPWFAPEFRLNPAMGHLQNGVFTCGFSIRRTAMETIRKFQDGRLFHPAFDGVWGCEDNYLGDLVRVLGLCCGGFPDTTFVQGVVGDNDAAYKMLRFREQYGLYLRLREHLARTFTAARQLTQGSAPC